MDRNPRAADVSFALLAMAVAVVIALFTMRIWLGELNKPVGYGGDGLLNLLLIKTVIRDGWFLHNSQVGAPYGLDLHDYAVGADNANFLIIKIMALASDWPPYILNAFSIFSFPLVALSGYCVLRALRIGRGASVCGAVLFAIIPVHFGRGTAHLFLANSWAVPLGAYLFVQVCRGEPLFRRRALGSKFNPISWATGRTAITIGLCVLVASDGIYYAAFTVALLVVAAVASLVSTRRYPGALAAAAAVGVIGSMVVVNLAPSIIYRHSHGSNRAVSQRLPVESEVYSLRFAQLVLPQPNHRVPELAALYQRWAGVSAHNGEGPQSPGTIGAIGLIFLLIVLVARVIGGSRRAALIADSRLTAFALGAAASIFFAASGGVAVLFAFFVSPQLRASNRISVFIAFFAIAAVVLAIDHWRPTREASVMRKSLFGLLLAAVVAFGSWDQTSPAYIPAYAQVKAAWDNDENYARSVERDLGGSGEVLQLPYHPFPEAVPLGKMMDYDQFRSPLHTSNIRWTYGAMKGRPTDWQAELSQLPVDQQVYRAVQAGMDGVEIDRFGYADDGGATEKAVAAQLGTKPIVSADQRLAFYDARPLAQSLRARGLSSLRARTKTLKPIQAEWGLGFTGPEPNGSRWADSNSELLLTNTTKWLRVVTLETVLMTVAPATTAIRSDASLPVTRTVPTTPEGTRVSMTLWVPPGGVTLSFSSDAPRKEAPPTDPRPMVLYFVEPHTFEGVLAPGSKATR